MIPNPRLCKALIDRLTDQAHIIPTGTALTVRGGATGRQYRFDWPGARVAVEPADAASVAAVPRLRRVEGRER